MDKVRLSNGYVEEPLVVVEVSHNGVPVLQPAPGVETPSPSSGHSLLAGEPAPSGAPAPAAVLARASQENFPVALRLLPAPERDRLVAIYGFARLVDDIGDELLPVEARPAALDWAEQELERARRHEATHPLFVALSTVLDLGDHVVAAMEDLITANRLDQVISRYETYDDLLASCALSANPVGRLVLAVFGALSAERLACSDDVCTGLQLAEHLQDLAEDARRGRIYLAAEDRRRWGCDEQDLLAPTASMPVRQLVADYARRARELLGSVGPLAEGLAVRHQLALAGFAAGGLAALDAIADAEFDVLGVTCRPSRWRLVVHGGRLLLAPIPQERDTAPHLCRRIVVQRCRQIVIGRRGDDAPAGDVRGRVGLR